MVLTTNGEVLLLEVLLDSIILPVSLKTSMGRELQESSCLGLLSTGLRCTLSCSTSYVFKITTYLAPVGEKKPAETIGSHLCRFMTEELSYFSLKLVPRS